MKNRLLLTFIMMISLVLAACSSKESAAGGEEGKLDYPKRPVELVVPFGEGSASDTFARKFADLLSTNTSQPVQPINKDGSGGLVGMVYAHGQQNDGYTVLQVTPSHVIADVLESGKDIKLMESFEPLAQIQSDIYVLSVPVNSPYKSFEELVIAGKEKEITFAGVSPGGLDDLTLNSLADETGIQVKFIPYKSGSEVKAAALGGEVDVYLDKLISAVGLIKDGKVKPIVVLNDKRIESIEEMKSTPSTVELGYETTIGSWRGFVVKKGTPAEVKEYLIDALKKTYDSPEYQQFAKDNLADIRTGYLGPEDFAKQWESEYEVFDAIAKKTGLKK